MPPDINYGDLISDPSFTDLLVKINNIIDSLPPQSKTTTNEENLSSLINQYVKHPDNSQPDEIKSLISSITVSAERLNRYKVYDEIYNAVQIIKQIINVYNDNVLQKDVVSGHVLSISPTQEDDSKKSSFEYCKLFSKEIIHKFDLVSKLKNTIVPFLLRYGDFFVEIIDLANDFIPIPKESSSTFITESKDYSQYEDLSTFIVDNFVTDETVINDDKLITEETKNTGYDVNKLSLRYHKPHNVVVIKTESDRVFGYIYIKKNDLSNDTILAPNYKFASILGQISGVDKTLNNDNSSTFIEKCLNGIIKKIVKQIKVKYEPNPKKSVKENELMYHNMVRKSMAPELFYMLKELLIELKETKNLSYRISTKFIPVDKMVHFQLQSTEYTPYGGSIIDPLVYPSKLYLLSQLANVVSKLSRAALIRKWIVETGPRNQHSNLIQKLKTEFRNQRITAEDILAFKSVPKILSDFKDLIVLSKKGNKFIDVEVQSLGDANLKIADIEDSRREIIALSGVPAPYLGYADTVELREQLVTANVVFANTISSIQEVITRGLTKLFDISFKICNNDKVDYKLSDIVSLRLTPPIVLMLQTLESTTSSIGNILQVLQTMRTIHNNPLFLLKRFVPYIDWDDYQRQGQLDALLIPPPPVASE
jgi:hypothetical protein